MKRFISYVTVTAYTFTTFVYSLPAQANGVGPVGNLESFEMNLQWKYKYTHKLINKLTNTMGNAVELAAKAPMKNCEITESESGVDYRPYNIRYKCTENPYFKIPNAPFRSLSTLGDGVDWKQNVNVIEAEVSLDELLQGKKISGLSATDRKFVFQINAPRSVRPVVIENQINGIPIMGQYSESERTINRFFKSNFFQHYVVGGKLYIGGCFLSPGFQVGGVPVSNQVRGMPVNSTSAKIQSFLHKDNIRLHINPGSFTFDKFQACALYRIVKSQSNQVKVELVDMPTPTLSNPKYAGLDISVSGINVITGIFYAIIGFIGGLFKFLSTGDLKWIGFSFLSAVVGVFQAGFGFFNNLFQKLVNKALDKFISNKITNLANKKLQTLDQQQFASEYVSQGRANEDIAVNTQLQADMNKALFAMYDIKQQNTLLLTEESISIIGNSCANLAAKHSKNIKLKGVITAACRNFAFSISQDPAQAAMGCNNYMWLNKPMPTSPIDYGNVCKFDVKIQSKGPASLKSLYECVFRNGVNNEDDLATCNNIAKEFADDMGILDQVNVSKFFGTVDEVIAKVNYVKQYKSKFSQIESFLKNLRGAINYSPDEAFAILKRVVENNEDFNRIRIEMSSNPEMIEAVKEQFTQSFRREINGTELSKYMGYISSRGLQGALKNIESDAKNQLKSVFNAVSMSVTQQAITQSELTSVFNKFISSNDNLDQIKNIYRNELIESQRTDTAIKTVYKRMKRVEISESLKQSVISRLKSGGRLADIIRSI